MKIDLFNKILKSSAKSVLKEMGIKDEYIKKLKDVNVVKTPKEKLEEKKTIFIQ